MPQVTSKNHRPKPVPRQPLWRGPDVDGITQSLLGRFLECRERFRLKVVEGLVEDEGFSRPLEFGNFWHAAEEARLAGQPWDAAIKRYRLLLERRYPNDTTEIFKWYNVCKTQFPIYLKYWEHHKDEKAAKPILEECSFKVPYGLPSGRVVILRGKWDALRLLGFGKSKRPAIYIKEHKTKGEIDEEGILKTVAWNLQTMMYQIALRECADQEQQPADLHGDAQKAYWDAIMKYPIGGVLYNVVRRPLADRYAIKQKKSESITTFYNRLGGVIKADAKNYFMRWRIDLTDDDIATFKKRTFHPIMESLCDWWGEIRDNPFEPWDRGNRHFQAPWGCFNSLAGGFRGSYFDYLTTGREYGLTKTTNLFPELS